MVMNRGMPSHPLSMLGYCVIVLVLDYLTGPEIQFPIAFALPVVIAAWHGYRAGSIAIAVLLPAFRIVFGIAWGGADTPGVEAVNYVIRVVVLAGVAQLVQHMAALSREVRVLRGILPICSNCKKIRTERGTWTQMETYISEHSEAAFSHGLCSSCAEELYPQYFGKGVHAGSAGSDQAEKPSPRSGGGKIEP